MYIFKGGTKFYPSPRPKTLEFGAPLGASLIHLFTVTLRLKASTFRIYLVPPAGIVVI